MSRKNLKSAFIYGRERLRRCGISGYALDAEVLLRHATGFDRAIMLTNPQMTLERHVVEKYCEYLRLREQRIPIAYITNGIEFMSLPMFIDDRAFIPRPDTEILVERALVLIDELAKNSKQISILELCTGSGCIALALAHYAKDVQVTAIDCSAEALELARKNAKRYAAGANIRFIRGDIYKPIYGLKFDIVIANPPYIPTADIGMLDADVRLYEPITALDGGADGLKYYRRLCGGAQNTLIPGGVVMFEIGFDQSAPVTKLLVDAGFETEIIKDLSGHDRVVVGFTQPQ